MSKPTEKVKTKTNPTRKRLIYETQQSEPRNEVLQRSDPGIEKAAAIVTTEAEVTYSVSATSPNESKPLDIFENEQSTTRMFQEEKGALGKLQESQSARELSAMKVAEVEFALDKATSGVAAATASVESSYKESKNSAGDEPFKRAMATLHTYSAMSAATGLIPLPLLDMAGLMTIQLLMLKKLSKHYNIPFDSQRSKSAIAILVSGINSGYVAASSSKLIPFFGAFSVAAMPVVNGALSYAVGRVFIKHFASGGTFLDFDPAKARNYFEEQYRK